MHSRISYGSAQPTSPICGSAMRRWSRRASSRAEIHIPVENKKAGGTCLRPFCLASKGTGGGGRKNRREIPPFCRNDGLGKHEKLAGGGGGGGGEGARAHAKARRERRGHVPQ